MITNSIKFVVIDDSTVKSCQTRCRRRSLCRGTGPPGCLPRPAPPSMKTLSLPRPQCEIIASSTFCMVRGVSLPKRACWGRWGGGEVGGWVSKGLLNVVGGRDVGGTLL